MSTFGIKKGERRFKPKASNTSKVKKRLRKEPETNKEQQIEEEGGEELNQDSNDSVIHDNNIFESTTSTWIESSATPPPPPRVPIVPLSQDLIHSTLNDYNLNKKKRKRAHGHSKEELILMAQKEREEKERQEAEQEQAGKKRKIPVPQVKLVNGEIVVDETSFHIRSEEEQETGDGDDNNNKGEDIEERQVVDEGPFIQMQRGSNPPQQSKRWTVEETDLFYELLKEFGLDFTTISTHIPGRTQEQIRRKYYKEHKRYPSKINRLFTNQ